MRNVINKIWRSLGILVLLSTIALSQNSNLDKAIQMAISGKHKEADFRNILSANYHKIEARIVYGFYF